MIHACMFDIWLYMHTYIHDCNFHLLKNSLSAVLQWSLFSLCLQGTNSSFSLLCLLYYQAKVSEPLSYLLTWSLQTLFLVSFFASPLRCLTVPHLSHPHMFRDWSTGKKAMSMACRYLSKGDQGLASHRKEIAQADQQFLGSSRWPQGTGVFSWLNVPRATIVFPDTFNM